MPKSNGDLSDLYASLNFSNYPSPEQVQTQKSMEALNRLNSYFSKPSAHEQRTSLDSVWNDTPKNDDIIGAAMKTRMNMDGTFPISRLLAQTYSYSSDSSSSPNGLPSRYSPPQINSRQGGVFSYSDDTPESRGLAGSASSRQSYSYSSESGSLNSRGTVISPSEPGSPTLDDAILMGCRPKNGYNRSYSNGVSSSRESTLSDLMNSLSLTNSNYGSRHSPLNGSIGSNQHQNCLSPNNNYMMSSNLGLNNFSSNSSPACNSNLQQGADLSALAQLQNACLATHLLPNLVDHPNLLGIFSELRNHIPLSPTNGSDPYALEKAAKLHRNAAAVCEANCTWSGQLPLRTHKNPFYSCKVFLGGVPWDVTEIALKQAFVQFGCIQVEWPGKDNSANPPKGFVYVLFENEKQVKALLANCTQDFTSDNYYFKISSRRMRQKEVQVIPWVLSDSNYVRCPSFQLDPAKTVFVGALHGMLSAEGLANIMNDLFGGVVYSGSSRPIPRRLNMSDVQLAAGTLLLQRR